ncbi:MAG TPA: DDE-type integrase/transposase/recombinase, partial [Thermoanaerobaculia bacterium]|nr:DDE-type integrase/transposase/recombinase [Thermoanaerobaculia bacterium]
PRSQPGRTERRCEQALLEARQRRPAWGPRKLLVRLASEHPSWPWPAASTAGAILKRHGLVEARPRRRARASPAQPVLEAPHPNALWAADFKGEFRTGDHQLCYPLTVTDRFSRYLLGCRARRSTSLAGVRPVFERLFAEHGLPEAILTDGGMSTIPEKESKVVFESETTRGGGRGLVGGLGVTSFRLGV